MLSHWLHLLLTDFFRRTGKKTRGVTFKRQNSNPGPEHMEESILKNFY